LLYFDFFLYTSALWSVACTTFMHRKLLLCLSLVCLSSLTWERLTADEPVLEMYDDKPVAHIEISPENLPPQSAFDPKSIKLRLKTKVGDPFSQFIFDSDLKTLAEDYDRVEPHLQVQNGQVYIQIKVWPRPTIQAIHWTGNTHIKTRTLQKELGVKVGAVFNREGFNKAFNKIKEFYIKKGYFEAQLQYSLAINPLTNEADVSIQIDEGRSGHIEDIRFKGFSKKEESALLEMMHTKKYNLLLSWFQGTGIYNEEALDQDQLTIINFLQNDGYADARVNIQIIEAKSEGKIILEISCEKGPIFHIGEVTLSGNELFSEEEIREKLLIESGSIYSPEKIRDTSSALKELYGRKGYIDANISYESKLLETQPIYDIHFEIDEGEIYKIGMIHIFGNVQTQSYVILRESLLVPGETFDSQKLKRTQTRLENIGYFKSVNVYAVRTQDDQLLGDTYRDVYIEVEETTTGNLSLFGGFSTADDLFGGLDLAETNFNYKGIPKIFKHGLAAVRGGGEYAHARLTIGEKQRTISLAWLTPYFRDTLWRVGFDVSRTYSRLQSDDYSTQTLGGTFYASYPINSLWAFGCKYRLRDARTHTRHHVSREERTDVDSSGVISAVGSSINFDSTDSAMKPHNGFRSGLEAEFAGVGGAYHFLHFNYINAYYKSLWKNGILKFRADLKFILPLLSTNTPGDIPISERFFLGGENSVRGYRPFDLGPHFENGNPSGGISSSLFSLEYLHEIFSFLDGFIFFDMGNVSLKRFYVGLYNMSYGYGIRCDALNNIPITIGMGYPINPDNRSQVHKFFFSMGGQF
jgi:outer membrane protein insertion porin family